MEPMTEVQSEWMDALGSEESYSRPLHIKKESVKDILTGNESNDEYGGRWKNVECVVVSKEVAPLLEKLGRYAQGIGEHSCDSTRSLSHHHDGQTCGRPLDFR